MEGAVMLDRFFKAIEFDKHIAALHLLSEDEVIPADPRVSFAPEGINLYSASRRVELERQA
jgi:hypothetical protein